MEINHDVNAVIIDLKLYEELLKMADVAIGELRSYETVVQRINKHVRRYNPHVAAAYAEQVAEQTLKTKAQRARIKALFRAEGKTIYYREGKDLFWPVRIGELMKYDWTFVRMQSTTQHRQFTKDNRWQHLDRFVIQGELPLRPYPGKPGAYLRALTQAERDAEWAARELQPVKPPERYNVKVVINRSSLTLSKVRLNGEVFVETAEQDEIRRYAANIKPLLYDLVDQRFVQRLYFIAEETFRDDSYFNELLIEQCG